MNQQIPTTLVDDDTLHEKLADATTPGFQVEFDPDEADRAGAFVEDALSEQDAIASSDDMTDAFKPAFMDSDEPNEPSFSHFRTLSAAKLYDIRLGETVAQAASRKAAEQEG
jgi:hypothetical protein